MFKTNYAIKSFISFVVFMFITNLACNAYEIILPKTKKYSTTSNYALFVGKANNIETVTINNEKVYIASNGAFTHSVLLKEGDNRVVIRSNYNTQIYKINKKILKKSQTKDIVDFDKELKLVKKDNVPLRSTPIDAGLNRIAHLFKGTHIYVNGEQGNFYRVFLSKDKVAWISKNDVEEFSKDQASLPSEFIDMSGKVYSNANIQEIVFTKNLPYTVEILDKEILFRIYNPEASDSSVYTINIPKPDKYYYKVNLENGKYTFNVSELPYTLQDCTIVVDAGHGGSEKGAIGCLGELEKDINLKVALELQKLLKEKGAKVIMTRECDGTTSLEDRVQIAKDSDAEIFLSIHHNSIPDVKFDLHKHRGTSIYYFNDNSKQFAKILENKITKLAGTKKNGIHTASFAVVRPAHYIGVLVETSYMINPLDSLMYNSENYAEDVAKGIVEGLEEFVGE